MTAWITRSTTRETRPGCGFDWGRGGGLELAAPALRLHRLLGDELRQGEQRLLRLRCVVVGFVVGDVLGGEVAAGAVDHVAELAGVDEEGFVAAVLDRYETCPLRGNTRRRGTVRDLKVECERLGNGRQGPGSARSSNFVLELLGILLELVSGCGLGVVSP